MSECSKLRVDACAIQKLKKSLCNFTPYPDGCGIQTLGTVKKPVKVIEMASTVNFSDDLEFKDRNGGTTMKLSGGNIVGNVNGNITGNVTGNVTGNLTGNVTGNVTGTLFGNVDASPSTDRVILPNNGNVSTANSAPGSIIYNTSSGKLMFHDGSAWRTVTST